VEVEGVRHGVDHRRKEPVEHNKGQNCKVVHAVLGHDGEHLGVVREEGERRREHYKGREEWERLRAGRRHDDRVFQRLQDGEVEGGEKKDGGERHDLLPELHGLLRYFGVAEAVVWRLHARTRPGSARAVA
jgi:hypothetical protein